MSKLDLSLGALEVSILISTILYGISILQVFLYSERGFKDPLWLRTLVSRLAAVSFDQPFRPYLTRLGWADDVSLSIISPWRHA